MKKIICLVTLFLLIGMLTAEQVKEENLPEEVPAEEVPAEESPAEESPAEESPVVESKTDESPPAKIPVEKIKPEENWIRRSVLGIEPVNTGNNFIAVPLDRCDENGRNCHRMGFFRYTLTPQDISDLSWQIYERMIEKRYDTILAGEKNLTIISQNHEKAFKTSNIPDFDQTDSRNFRESMKKYSSGIENLMQQVMNHQYWTISKGEQNEYLERKSKETGLHREIIPPFMNIDYIFGVDINSIDAIGKIIPVKVKGGDGGGTSSGYHVNFDIAINANVFIFRYDIERPGFVYYRRLKVSSSDRLISRFGLNNAAHNYIFSKEIPEPDAEELKELWKKSFVFAAKNTGISANYRLRNNRHFSPQSPVISVYGSNIEAKSGIEEDMRVDQPVAILRQVDGITYRTGFAKARAVGENCSNRQNTTRFRRTAGNAQEGDKVQTIPWSGAMFSLGGGINQYRISFIEKNEQGREELMRLGGLTFGNHFGLSLDLGYLTNVRFFSETWLSFGGFFYSGYKATVGYYKAPVLGGGYLGLSHRIHLTRGGAFIAPQVKLNSVVGGAEVSQYSPNEGDFIFRSFNFEPGLQIGFTFNPFVEMILQGGYHLPFYSDLYKDKIRLPDDKVGFKNGFTALLSFQVQIPGSSKASSKPSSVCRAIELSQPDYDSFRRKRPDLEPQSEEKEKPEKTEPEKPVFDEKVDISKLLPSPFDKTELGVIDLIGIEIEIITAYDNAVNTEKEEGIENRPAQAVEAWKLLAEMEGENPFKEIAEKRVVLWIKYLFAWNEIMKEKEQAKSNLLKILPLSSITHEQKLHAVTRYFNEYGIRHGISDVIEFMSGVEDQEMILKIMNEPAFDETLKKVLNTRCGKGNSDDCFTYGKTFPQGDENREKYLKKSCELGYEEACATLKSEEEEEEEGEESNDETMMEKYGY